MVGSLTETNLGTPCVADGDAGQMAKRTAELRQRAKQIDVGTREAIDGGLAFKTVTDIEVIIDIHRQGVG